MQPKSHAQLQAARMAAMQPDSSVDRMFDMLDRMNKRSQIENSNLPQLQPRRPIQHPSQISSFPAHVMASENATSHLPMAENSISNHEQLKQADMPAHSTENCIRLDGGPPMALEVEPPLDVLISEDTGL